MVQDPLAWHRRVQSSLERWRTREEAGRSRLAEWRAVLPECQRGVLGRLDTFFMAEMLQECGHEDNEY
eukprot:404400-Pyramimonas_sp.AAC.1